MIRSFYFNKIVYYIAGAAAILYALSYFIPSFYRIAGLMLVLLGVAVLIDMILVYSKNKGITASRELPERFSVGDQNKVQIRLTNHYAFTVKTSIIDELPVQFQDRNWIRKLILQTDQPAILDYTLRPETRGEYTFHDINVFVHAPLKLVRRRFVFEQEQVVKVYPSYFQMRRYQLLAMSNRLQDAGVKTVRSLADIGKALAELTGWPIKG